MSLNEPTRLELLRTMIPWLASVGVIVNPLDAV
jgi:hypothetical protein